MEVNKRIEVTLDGRKAQRAETLNLSQRGFRAVAHPKPPTWANCLYRTRS
jgi:hypothetical protein